MEYIFLGKHRLQKLIGNPFVSPVYDQLNISTWLHLLSVSKSVHHKRTVNAFHDVQKSKGEIPFCNFFVNFSCMAMKA